jgi:hypothetical protein
MLALNTSHGMIASMAAKGSPPDCLASSSAADAGVQAHLVVDRFAGLLEALLSDCAWPC